MGLWHHTHFWVKTGWFAWDYLSFINLFSEIFSVLVQHGGGKSVGHILPSAASTVSTAIRCRSMAIPKGRFRPEWLVLALFYMDFCPGFRLYYSWHYPKWNMVSWPHFVLPEIMTCSQSMAVSWSFPNMALFSSREATGLQKAISMAGMPGPVWHSSEWLNAQISVASSCSKPPHAPADAACGSVPIVTLRVAQHMAHSALIAEWRWNDTVCLSVARVHNLIRAQFSAGAHSWACSCMQLLTGLERASVTGCGGKKTDVNRRNSWNWGGSSGKKVIKKNNKRQMLWL